MINKCTQKGAAAGCARTSDMKENTCRGEETRSKAGTYTMEYDSAAKSEEHRPRDDTVRESGGEKIGMPTLSLTGGTEKSLPGSTFTFEITRHRRK